MVSRGGRPDLAGDALPKVKAPTVLIVGGEDQTVIELNEGTRKCDAKCNWRLSRARHIFLRNQADSSESPSWRVIGSLTTSARNEYRNNSR